MGSYFSSLTPQDASKTTLSTASIAPETSKTSPFPSPATGNSPSSAVTVHQQSPSSPSSSLSATQSNDGLSIAKPQKHVVDKSFQIKAQRPFPLNAAQEAEVKELYYKRVRDMCNDEIRGDLRSSSLSPYNSHVAIS